MNLERTVLLVSPTPTLANALELSLRRTGYRLTVARTYQAAKSHLGTAPQVLVTELKLGAYNGLQLALRTRTRGTRSVIVADKAFEAEIEQLGATWVSLEAAASGELPSVIGQLLAAPVAETNWPDRPEGDLEALDPFAGHDAIVH
jgi:CheY-like chemotaxis protein